MERAKFFRVTVASRRNPAIRLVLLAAAAASAACTGGTEAPVDESSKQLILDDSKGGSSGLYFLPPMVPRPVLHGTFARDFSPVVRIDELSGPQGDVLRTLATYTTTGGKRSERVRVTDSHYIVEWRMDHLQLSRHHVYRIHVLLGDRSLGFADVQPVGDGRRMKNLSTRESVTLGNRHTLPIKFWLNACAAVVCDATDQCHEGGVCDGDTGQCSSPPVPDGTVCDDGNLCTQTDTCLTGTCTGGNPLVCAEARGICDPSTGLCSPTEALPVCGNSVLESSEECDDGNTFAGDGCGTTCKTEFCGDGSLLRTLGQLRFIFLGRSCNGSPEDISFSLNGIEVARVPMPSICDCNPGIVTVDVTDPTLLALARNGDNVFEFLTTGDIAWVAMEAAGPWGALAYSLGDSSGGGDAEVRNPDICTAGSQLGAWSGVGFELWGGDECDDGNIDNDDACTNSCTVNTCLGVSCTSPGQCQTTGSCNPATGTCEYLAQPDGTPCDDQSLCTDGDFCAAGSCVGTSTVQCPSAPNCAMPPVCVPATGQCSAAAECSACGDGAAGAGEECDDGNTLAGDGCGPTCRTEFCGDGSLLRTLSWLRFVFLGRSCNSTPDDIAFYLNGAEVARAPMPSICGCQPGVVTVDVTDPALLALGRNGDNVFEFSTTGDIAWVAMEAAGPWGALVYSIGDSSGGGDADSRNPDICAAGSQIGAWSGVVFGLWGGEACDDGNGDNGDACSNYCTINP